jgi:tRNA-specific 2-thiouridylase
MKKIIEKIQKAYAHVPLGSTVAIGMSGGVDSSVTAYLMQQAGYEVFGIFMQNWSPDEPDPHCTAEQDLSDAQSICNQLGIPLHAVNFSQDYWDLVFAKCLEVFQAGDTPNPDVLCNRHIKFNKMLEHAKSLGADYLATGHYAQNIIKDDLFCLARGLDHQKDQSYFLYLLNQHQLSHAIFPLGSLEKSEVRLIAEQQNFITADKKDSTGICFIGERQFKPFLQEFMLKKPGNMITPEGENVGKHDGLMFYTLGQRQGLNIGGRKDSSGKPWYVAGKNFETNALVVVQGSDHPALYAKKLTAMQVHWIGKAPELNQAIGAKTRYRQKDQKAKVVEMNTDRFILEFSDPQFAVTPGQSVVCYDGNICLGGGIICR